MGGGGDGRGRKGKGLKRGVGGRSAINWETGHPIKQFVRIKGIEEWRAGEGGGRQSREIDLRMDEGEKTYYYRFKWYSLHYLKW